MFVEIFTTNTPNSLKRQIQTFIDNNNVKTITHVEYETNHTVVNHSHMTEFSALIIYEK